MKTHLKTNWKTLTLVSAIAVLAACAESTPVTQTSGSDGQRDDHAAQRAPAAVHPSSADSTPVDAARTEADYLGRWTGVEGMYLLVSAKPTGGVTLEMQWDLDHKGSFDGSVTAEGLRFMRNGIAETAVHGNGEATGLKHLAGKQDCLTVKPGEGYCRD